jgi:hypothetical protein
VALASSTFAEPPSPSHSYGLPSISSSYGAPQISSGYDYQPSAVSTEYVQKHVGNIPSEGYNLDPHLLDEIKHVLIAHENEGKNSGSSGSSHGISSTYGVPQSQYGPPSHWMKSSKVVDLDFGHLQQSLPVAYYLGTDRYASKHVGSGWSSGSSNSGWSSGSSGSSGNSGWSSGSSSSGWSKPAVVSQPSIQYVFPPRVQYVAPVTEWSSGSSGSSSGSSGSSSSGWSKPSVQYVSQPITYASPPRVTYGAPSVW